MSIMPRLAGMAILTGLFLGQSSWTGDARAADAPSTSKGIVDEVKLGVLAHDVGFLGNHREKGADVNAEVLFTAPSFLKILWSPRPQLGLDVNGSGGTDSFYAGLAWDYTVTQRVFGASDALFLQGSLGLAGQDGAIDTRDPHRKSLGSAVLFRESAEAGWRFSQPFSLSLFIDHISNAGIFKRNEGLTSVGTRIGYKF